MQGQSLQTMKWYKGSQEFYRYQPRNYPDQKQFFVLPKLHIDVSISRKFSVDQIFSAEIQMEDPSRYQLQRCGNELELFSDDQYFPHQGYPRFYLTWTQINSDAGQNLNDTYD